MVIAVLSIALFLAYSALIFYYWRAWENLPEFLPDHEASPIPLSVVIAARNEQEHISDLLQALELQDYPKTSFQTVVVNDHSEDGTEEKVKAFKSVRLINLSENGINSYKKKAIETAVRHSDNDWILATDADCLPQSTWLKTIAAYQQASGSELIAAPVSINCGNSPIEIFQAMDMMVLQGITAAGISKDRLSMANGANLCYRKKDFIEVGGYKDVNKLASGDDMFLFYKLRQHGKKAAYLKSRSAIVATEPMKTWRDFLNQRIRWASKARGYQDKRLLPVLLLVYCFNLAIAAIFIAAFFSPKLWWLFLGLLIGKTVVELPFFISLSRFFDKTWAIKVFFFFQPLHIIYTVVSGLLGQFGTYEWKGRRVK